MNDTSETANRPTSISVICAIGFFGSLISLPVILSPTIQQIGSWFPSYLLFSVIVGVACMVGLWSMKKWAAYTYTGFVALNQIVLLTAGQWNLLARLIPAIVIFFALKHVSAMS